MLLAALALVAFQQKPPHAVDPSALSLDLTRFASVEGLSASAFWCPPEFFRHSLRQRENLSAAEIEKTAEAFRAVNLFAVSVAETKQGTTSHLDAEAIAHRLILRTESGKEFLPLEPQAVAPELRAFAASLRPGLAAALGPSGKSVALVFFPGSAAEGKPLLSPSSSGKFSLLLKGPVAAGKSAEFSWKLPLPSLLEEKSCSRCKERCRGDWLYCPWDGAKL